MSDQKKVNIIIDGQKIEAPLDQPVLRTALDNGIRIPHFCYFRDLMPDGNCRMCMVEVEKIKKLQISCMTYPAEGMVVYTNTPRVRAAQKSVLEFILVNHPLDCPICDKVGECELQANYFNFSGEKSHFLNPYAKVRFPKLQSFSDRILYDAERCIKCARCSRFTTEVSKTYGLGLVNRSVYTTVATAGHEYKDNYSDCVCDICPVGALTTKHFRFQARVFTLSSTLGVCPLCSRGCNTFIQHKHNKLYRVMPRRNPDVNKSWMCNAGRDLYMYLNRPRSSASFYRGNEIPYQDAVAKLKTILSELSGKEERKILAVASSFGFDEEIKAFVELFQKTLRADLYFKTDSILNEKQYPADSFLITNDKNPSRYTLVNTYGLKEIDERIPRENWDLLLIWGEGLQNSLSKDNLSELLTKSRNKVLLTPFQENGWQNYDLVVPTRTFVEKQGRFTNMDGRTSYSFMAFELYPHLKAETDLFEELSVSLNHKSHQ